MAERAKVEGRKQRSLSGEFDMADEKGNLITEDADHESWKVAAVQILCCVAVFVGVWIVPSRTRDLNLIFQPVKTLQVCLVVVFPTVLIGFSSLRSQPKICPVWWAALRGIASLPVGIVVASFLAVVFGAPLSHEATVKTLYWGSLVSTLTVVPVAIVVGSSWPVWHRLFALTRPKGMLEIALCIPAHCVAVGTWVGAWPMPLDWERPWQDWPVCCTYGAVGGYFVGVILSVAWHVRLGDKEIKRKDD